MSNKHITLAFKADLSPTMKLTLIAVCDSVDEDGTWKLRYDTIAKKTSQSRRAVMGHIKKLTDMGVMSIQKTRREDGRQGANIFTVYTDALEKLQSADNDKSQSADDVVSETQSADDDNSRVQMASFQSAANDTPITPSYPQTLPPEDPPLVPPVDLKPKKPDRKTGMPPNFEPDREYALGKGYTDDQTSDLAEQFRNHHEANGSKFVSWPAAWRKWIGNDIKWNGKPGERGGDGRETGRIAAAFGRALHELETMPDDDPRRWV